MNRGWSREELSEQLWALGRVDADDLPRDATTRIGEFVVLQRASLEIARGENPEQIAHAVIEVLESLLPYRRTLVATVDAETRAIEVLAHAGPGIEQSRAERRRIRELIAENLDGGVIRWVIENGKPLRIDDAQADPRYLVGASAMCSELCVPILFGGRVLGAINVESENPGEFNRHDELLLSVLGNQVAVALENARLLRSARREIARREEAEGLLQASEKRYRALVENAGEGILVIADGRIRFVNACAARMLELSDDGLDDPALIPRIEAPDRERVEAAIAGATAQGGSFRETNVQLGGATVRRVDLTATQLEWNAEAAALLILADVTETVALTRRLAHEVSHDHLTGLLNRRALEERLGVALESCRTHGHDYVLCYIDLDQFKIVNDIGGHAAGDEMLRQIAANVGTMIRGRDSLARLGGDEFGLLLERCTLDQALRVTDMIGAFLRDYRLSWNGQDHAVGASIGVVALDADHPSAGDVLRAAGAACSASKESGRGRVRIFNEGDLDLVRRDSELDWVARVRRALAEDRFVLYGQKICPLRVAEPGDRYEILLRMRDADGGLVLPGRFMAAVERYDLAVSVDMWVIGRTLDWFARRPRTLAQLRMCSINLSARSLGNPELIEMIERSFVSSGVPPERICFEITETGAMRDLSASRGFIEDVRALGCSFALDDFGAGLSSFRYLRELPVQTLKIDGAFVRDLLDDPSHRAIVAAMNDLGHTLGMTTVAEFAAGDGVIAALRDLGLDFAQGYGVAMPGPLDDLAALESGSAQ